MKFIKEPALLVLALALLQGCGQAEFADPSAGSVPTGRKLPAAGTLGLLPPPPPQGQIYFQQDFNSSTNLSDYIGTGPNQFNAAQTVGNNTVNTLNNTFQVNKYVGTGNNRGGFTRSTPVVGGPARFLRFSMEVTMTRNHAVETNGFQITVGSITGTAPAAPGGAEIHSVIRFNPEAEEGVFRINTNNNQSSQPMSGTQHVIWYVNNTDGPVGYLAPNGSISSLQENHSDVWIMTETSAELVIDESNKLGNPRPALNGFKLANNPNFDATLDLDDIVLSEEPVIVIPEIVAVAPVAPIHVPIKVSLELLPLPSQVEVTYDDGVKAMAGITWAAGQGGYNKYNHGTYNVTGTIIPNEGTINPQGHSVATTVHIVKSDLDIVNAFTPNNDGKNDTWINPELTYYSVLSVEVFDRNGVRLFHTTDPNEGWDGKNQYGQVVAGSYNYVIKVSDLGLEKKGVVTVIK